MGVDQQTAGSHVARYVTGHDLRREVGRGHGVGEGEKAGIAPVRLAMTGEEMVPHFDARFAHILGHRIHDERAAPASDARGHGLDRDARRLGIETHGQGKRGAVALAEPGVRTVVGFDFQIEGPFGELGVLEVESHVAFGSLVVEFLIQHHQGLRAASYRDDHKAYPRGVDDMRGKVLCGTDPRSFRRNGHDGTVEIAQQHIRARRHGAEKDQRHQRGQAGFAFTHEYAP